VIITAVSIYLTCIFSRSGAFGSSGKPGLRGSSPKPSSNGHAEEAGGNAPPTPDHAEPVLYDGEKSLVEILLFGIPDWRERAYSYITIGINVVLAIFTLDLVFRGPLLNPVKDLRFSRVGYVDSTSAKVLFREPDPAQLPVYVYYKSKDQASWTTADRIYYLGPDTDFTYPVTFVNLQPETTYTYSLSNELAGTFTTAPSASSPRVNRLTFLTSSCMKANFPYRPFTHSLAIHGFEYLSKIVRSVPSPVSFMLFLGDFIYVDVPLRLSSSQAHYRSEYRRVYASPSWSLRGLSSLPWIHTLDDHEIANDWSRGNVTEPFPAASDPFIHYHVSVNPPIPPSAPAGPDTNTTYFQFAQGPASFFMLDTRRYRTDPEPPSSPAVPDWARRWYGSSNKSSHPAPRPHHSMLGSAQLASLLTYLATPEPAHIHWKIIASSVPFTKNWQFGTSDTWGGFLHERAEILTAMHAAERDLGVRVIILSGDRHEFAAIRFPPPIVELAPHLVYDRTPQSGPHEFSVGPLSMFYLPFRTFKQVDDEDVAIKYLPDGNSKVGVVNIQNLRGGGNNEQRSLLRYTLWVDGKAVWEYTLTSPGAAYQGDGVRHRHRGVGMALRDVVSGLWS